MASSSSHRRSGAASPNGALLLFALLVALLALGMSTAVATSSAGRRLRDNGGGDGEDGSKNSTCPDVPGYNWTVGVGNSPDTTIDDLSSSGYGNNATAMGLACAANCNCTAFNLQGELKANSTPTDRNVPPDACFYARQDPVICAPPAHLFNRRVLIAPLLAGPNTCVGWNGSVSVITSGGQFSLPPAGPAPIGTAGAGPCVAKPTTANDQMWIVTPTDGGFVTLRDGLTNGTRCLEVANASTQVGAFAQLSAGPCQNGTHQQFQLVTRTSGGYLILAKHTYQPLMTSLQATNALFQSAFDLNVLANNVSFTSFSFSITPEPVCPVAQQGYVYTPWAAVPTGLTPYTDLNTAPLPNIGATASACNGNCACTGYTSDGLLKSWIGAPPAVAAYGQCYYARATPKSCCPEIPGYTLTLGAGVADTTAVIYSSAVAPAVPGVALTAANLQQATGDCNNYCLCNGFTSTGKLLTYVNEVTTTFWGAQFCAYTKVNPMPCRTEKALSNQRQVEIVSKASQGCLSSLGASPAVTTACNDSYIPGMWMLRRLPGDPTYNALHIKDATGQLCLTQGDQQPDNTFSLSTTPCNVDIPAQQFQFLRTPSSGPGKYVIVTSDFSRCVVQAAGGLGRVYTTACANDDRQYFDVRLPPACKDVPGYALTTYRTRTDNVYSTRQLAQAGDPAALCNADCKCQAFSIAGDRLYLRNTTKGTNRMGVFAECYYRWKGPQRQCPRSLLFKAPRV